MFDVLVLLDCQLGDFQVAMTGGFWVAIRDDWGIALNSD
jgi:hypothetical protein